MEETNLLRDLERAWASDGAGPDAIAAIQRWAADEPRFGRFAHPAALVAACQSRRDQRAEQLVEDLADRALADPWAARTILQALLPGLAALTASHRKLVGPRRVFATLNEMDQFVLCTAFERITEVGAKTDQFRLRCVQDTTWARVRSHAAAHRREQARRAPLEAVAMRAAPPERTSAEELTIVLVDAVERGVLRRADAGLVYTTCVAGHAPADVASTLKTGTASLVRRRHRVAQVVVAHADGRRRPTSCVAAG